MAEVPMSNLIFQKELTGEEIFSIWQAQEGTIDSWQAVAKEKGWKDWTAWRSNSFEKIKGFKRPWKLYELQNAHEELPRYRLGPWKAWQNHFDEKNTATFADLISQQKEWVEKNDGVQRFLKDFPEGTQMIVLQFPDGSKTLFEGHHRAAAIALANELHTPLEISHPLKLAVTELDEDEVNLLSEFLQTGSEKTS